MKKTYEIKVLGRVQGVGFRAYVSNLATDKNICGKIQNREDGSVSIFVCMQDRMMDSFIKELKKGSSYSEVSCIKVEEIEDKSLDKLEGFYIIF